jgi:hypothetical protein
VVLLRDESVSVVTVGIAPTQTTRPTHAHLHQNRCQRLRSLHQVGGADPKALEPTKRGAGGLKIIRALRAARDSISAPCPPRQLVVNGIVGELGAGAGANAPIPDLIR